MRGRRAFTALAPLGVTVYFCVSSACSSSAGGPCDAPAADGKVSLACATDHVLNGGVGDGDPSGPRIYSWPQPLTAGTVIAEGIPDDGSPVTVASESWFFFVDLQPDSMFDHPTQFVLVDRGTGALAITMESSFPLVGDLALFATPEDRADPAFIVSGGITTASAPSLHVAQGVTPLSTWRDPNPVSATDGASYPLPNDPRAATFFRAKGESDPQFYRRFQAQYETPQSDSDMQRELGTCPATQCTSSQGKHYALIAGGGMLTRDAFAPLADGLRGLGWNVTQLSSYGAPNSIETTLPALRKAFADLAGQVKCCDEVLVAFDAHGTHTGTMDMNSLYHLRGPDDAGTPDASSITVGSPQGGGYPLADLRADLNAIQSCQTYVLIDTCFSGFGLENGLNKLDDSYAPQCMCRTVVSSSSARQTTGQGGEESFTTPLLAFLAQPNQTLSAAFSAAAKSLKTAEASKLTKNPDFNDNMCVAAQATDPSARCAPTSATPSAVIAGGLQDAEGLALDANFVYVTDTAAGQVWRYSKDGSQPSQLLASGLNHPTDIAVDDTLAFVVERGTGALLATGSDGSLVWTSKQAGPGSTTLANGLFTPSGIALSGNRVYFVSQYVDSDAGPPDAAVQFVSKTGGLQMPTAYAVMQTSAADVVATDGGGIYWTANGVFTTDGHGRGLKLSDALSPSYYDTHIATDGVSLFFTNETGGGVWRLPVGGGATPELYSGVGMNRVAVDDTFAYFTNGVTLYRVKKDALAFAGTPLVPIAQVVAVSPSAQTTIAGLAVDATSIYLSTAGDGRVLRYCKPGLAGY